MAIKGVKEEPWSKIRQKPLTRVKLKDVEVWIVTEANPVGGGETNL